MYIYNMYRKNSPLKRKQRCKEISKFMQDKELKVVVKEINRKSVLDKLYIILYKIQIPIIMDTVYSTREIIVKCNSIFKGIRK